MQDGEPMDTDKMQKTWVELREEGDGNRIVLKSVDGDIPPSRAPRRQLDLAAGGYARLREGDALDKLQETDAGAWRCDGKTLELSIKDWEGAYDIETVSDDTLILQRK